MKFQFDPHQERIINDEQLRSVLITGEAGFGKTTAALHRAASLARRARAAGRPFRTLVLVPSLGLVGKCDRILRSLQVAADVETLDVWIGQQARLVFSELEDKDSEEASAGVIRFKRHPAVREVFSAVLSYRARTHRDDLLDLWGDTALVGRVVSASDGALSVRDGRDVHEHALVQFAELDRYENGELVRGLFGPIHLGTPLHDALTSDVEDYPILFALERMRGGQRGPQRYEHIIVDEAQEFAPLELALIGQALAAGGALTVVGDAGQQVDPSAWFAGWSQSLAEIGIADVVRMQLTQSYRCPTEIVDFSRAILADTLLPPPSRIMQYAVFDAPAVWRDALVDWLRGQRVGRVALVVWDAAQGRALQRQLPRDLGVRLRLDADSAVDGSAIITTVSHLRGLEVERIAVPDLCGTRWPATASGRRALYVALTRASRAAWAGALSTDRATTLLATQ